MMKNAFLVSVLLLVSSVVASDTLVQRLVGEVCADSIGATIQRLQDLGTREARTDSNRVAVRYAFDRFTAYECDSVFLHQFDTVYGFGPNVIGLKRGRLYPDIEYIVSGHIDSQGPHRDSAPGADDNASGVSVVLEAARVFAQHWFNYSVRFFCTNAEEYTSGMGRYLMRARERGDSILGGVCFDMVGYALDGRDSVTVLGKMQSPDCSRLLNVFQAAGSEYTGLKARPVRTSRDTLMGLDHSYFWMFGYPALMVMELDRTPCTHELGDTIGLYHYELCGVNDLPMCAEVAEAAVAAIAALAQVDGIAGVEEGAKGQRRASDLRPTIVRGSLVLHGSPVASRQLPACLLTPVGRKVADLHPGANDVWHLSPGVYFVVTPHPDPLPQGERGRNEPSAVCRRPSAVAKVLLAR